jgi:hypothetical protein
VQARRPGSPRPIGEATLYNDLEGRIAVRLEHEMSSWKSVSGE